MAETPETKKSDFSNVFPIRDGSMMSGHAHGEELVLGGRGDEFCAIGAHCTFDAACFRHRVFFC